MVRYTYLHWCDWDQTRAFDPTSLHAWRDTMVQAGTHRPGAINAKLSAVKRLIRAGVHDGTLPPKLSVDFNRVTPVPTPPRSSPIGRPPSTLAPENRQRLRDLFPGLAELPGRLSPRSVDGYHYDARIYAEWCHWERQQAHDPSSLRLWIQYQVLEGLSPNTINRRRASLLTILRLSAAGEMLDERIAFKFGLIPAVKRGPLRDRLKVFKPLSPAEVRKLCQCPSPLSLIGLRDRALLLVLASSGIRIHEALGLKQEHVVPLATGWGLKVLGKGQAKERLAPLSKEAYAAVTRWLSARDLPGCAWIFTSFTRNNPNDHPLDRSQAWRNIKKYARQIGRGDVSAHDFRRFLGTQTTAKFGIRQAQKALGHTNINSTEKYVLDELPPQLTEDLF